MIVLSALAFLIMGAIVFSIMLSRAAMQRIPTCLCGRWALTPQHNEVKDARGVIHMEFRCSPQEEEIK